jgi:hypothetical protein
MDADDPDVPLFGNLDDDDPAVLVVVSEAKRTLPQFLDAASSGRFSPATYLVKVPFIDRSGTGEQALARTPDRAVENPGRPIYHLWLSVTSVLGDLVFCSVGEAPKALQLQRGTSFVIASESIEDWMIHHGGGDTFGGFSLQVIRGRLSGPEQMRFDTHTGIRSFKGLMP